jgi:hypothetical protein
VYVAFVGLLMLARFVEGPWRGMRVIERAPVVSGAV